PAPGPGSDPGPGPDPDPAPGPGSDPGPGPGPDPDGRLPHTGTDILGLVGIGLLTTLTGLLLVTRHRRRTVNRM
ncbi:MAG: LPXTG cell wall anchor domain-containing protein, partial [Cellulomonas sp.]|nr:LPXTG cell wall anchor domain-containing protein [Cellulomonas sp.]